MYGETLFYCVAVTIVKLTIDILWKSNDLKYMDKIKHVEIMKQKSLSHLKTLTVKRGNEINQSNK